MGAECRCGGRQRRAATRPLKFTQPSVKISLVLFGAAAGSERASGRSEKARSTRNRLHTPSEAEHVPPLPNLDRRKGKRDGAPKKLEAVRWLRGPRCERVIYPALIQE